MFWSWKKYFLVNPYFEKYDLARVFLICATSLKLFVDVANILEKVSFLMLSSACFSVQSGVSGIKMFSLPKWMKIFNFMMISFSQGHDLRLLDQLIPYVKFWQSSRWFSLRNWGFVEQRRKTLNKQTMPKKPSPICTTATKNHY